MTGKIDDEHIIRKVLEGDVDLFRLIVERHQKKIYNIGMRFYRNPDDAADFTQEVFLRAYNNLGTFKGLSKFYFWLMKVAYNHGINAVKAVSPEESSYEDFLPDSGASPEKAHLRGEIAKTLQKALRELPEKYRLCIEFYFFYNLTYLEISEITGYPVNTIKSHVFRAKQVLRDGLQGTIAEEYEDM